MGSKQCAANARRPGLSLHPRVVMQVVSWIARHLAHRIQRNTKGHKDFTHLNGHAMLWEADVHRPLPGVMLQDNFSPQALHNPCNLSPEHHAT